MIRSAFFALFLVACGGTDFTTGFSTSGADALTPDGGHGMTGTGGEEADAVTPLGTGGAPASSGGASNGGKVGAATGGAPVATGGSPAATGGVPVTTGGAPATGGAPIVDACVPVTHSNGLGQTWTDCVPSGTYDLSEAMRACKASGAERCIDSQGCGAGNLVVIGYGVTACVGSWGYGGFVAGFTRSAADCGACPISGAWN